MWNGPAEAGNFIYYLGQPLSILQFAFPYDNRSPARCPNRLYITRIALPVPAEFFIPELQPRFWLPSEFTSFMLVPEAAMDENCKAASRQKDVRFAT